MELVVKNFMEDIVRDKMPEILASMENICRCERCEMDRLAFALNNCPPKYVVTEMGEIFTRLKGMERQFDSDLTRAITEAAIRVDENPRCNQH